MGESIGPSSFYNPTLSANKHTLQIFRFSLSVAANGLADGSGELWAAPFNGDAQNWNGIERSLSRAYAVAPQSLLVSSTRDVGNSVVLCAVALAKEWAAIQAVLHSRTVAIWKGKHQVGLFFFVESCQRNITGWSTAGWQWTQRFNFSNVIHLDAHQAPCLSLPVCVSQSSTVCFLAPTPTSALERFIIITKSYLK